MKTAAEPIAVDAGDAAELDRPETTPPRKPEGRMISSVSQLSRSLRQRAVPMAEPMPAVGEPPTIVIRPTSGWAKLRLGEAGRRHVERHHGWESCLAPLGGLLDRTGVAP